MENKKHESMKEDMKEDMKERMKGCTEVKCDMGGPGSSHSKSVKLSMQGRKDYN